MTRPSLPADFLAVLRREICAAVRAELRSLAALGPLYARKEALLGKARLSAKDRAEVAALDRQIARRVRPSEDEARLLGILRDTAKARTR